MEDDFKVNDRVKRNFKRALVGIGEESQNRSWADELPAGLGTIKAIKEETTASVSEGPEARMFLVAWDNSTSSYLGQDGLELVKRP